MRRMSGFGGCWDELFTGSASGFGGGGGVVGFVGSNEVRFDGLDGDWF